MRILYILYTVLALCKTQTDLQVSNPEYQAYLNEVYSGFLPGITVESLQGLGDEKIYYLDSREQQEYRVSHIKYARQVGNLWFDMRDVYDIPKDAFIVVYCTIGDRSQRVGEKLVNAGYSQVYFLYGGMIEWMNMGNPVYTEKEIQTPQVLLSKKSWESWLEKGKAIF